MIRLRDYAQGASHTSGRAPQQIVAEVQGVDVERGHIALVLRILQLPNGVCFIAARPRRAHRQAKTCQLREMSGATGAASMTNMIVRMQVARVEHVGVEPGLIGSAADAEQPELESRRSVRLVHDCDLLGDDGRGHVPLVRIAHRCERCTMHSLSSAVMRQYWSSHGIHSDSVLAPDKNRRTAAHKLQAPRWLTCSEDVKVHTNHGRRCRNAVVGCHLLYLCHVRADESLHALLCL